MDIQLITGVSSLTHNNLQYIEIRAKLDFNKVKIFKENTIIPFDISL